MDESWTHGPHEPQPERDPGDVADEAYNNMRSAQLSLSEDIMELLDNMSPGELKQLKKIVEEMKRGRN